MTRFRIYPFRRENSTYVERDGDVPDCLSVLPVAASDWMFGYNEKPNAFVYVRDGKLCILPTKGGWLGVETDKLLGDIAPFAD